MGLDLEANTFSGLGAPPGSLGGVEPFGSNSDLIKDILFLLCILSHIYTYKLSEVIIINAIHLKIILIFLISLKCEPDDSLAPLFSLLTQLSNHISLY